MRWIFWRHKPPLKNEPGRDSLHGEPEITVFIDSEDAKLRTKEVGGVVMSPLPNESGRERLRHRHKLANADALLDRTVGSAAAAHGITALLHLPKTLLGGRLKFGSAAEIRASYFTPGAYAGGIECIRMMAPAVRRALLKPSAAINLQSQSLPAAVTPLKLPPARKEA